MFFRDVCGGYRFSDLFDAFFTLVSDLSTLTNQNVPLRLFIGLKSLFDITSKGYRTSEKRLMSDVIAAQQGFQMGDI